MFQGGYDRRSMHCSLNFPNKGDGAHTRSNYPENEMTSEDFQIFGWKNGKYGILPRLLFSMESPLELSILELQCIDENIASMSVRRNGSITSPRGFPGALFFFEFVREVPTTTRS